MQEALFTPAHEPGRHELALEKTVEQALSHGLIDSLDDALVSIARASAWALDAAEREGKPYAVASMAAPYRETLEALQLTPLARKGDADDGLRAALEALADSHS